MAIWRPSKRRLKISYKDKILKRLDGNSLIDPKTNCKLWLGGKGSNGHGQTSFHNKTVLIHRLVMHILKNFDLKSKNNINHIRECPNPNCWNIEHLYEGDQKSNMQDRRANTTHCPKGHEYTSKNTLINKRGSKCCRACHNERERNRK